MSPEPYLKCVQTSVIHPNINTKTTACKKDTTSLLFLLATLLITSINAKNESQVAGMLSSCPGGICVLAGLAPFAKQ
jgi:hypothetical protein